MKLSELKPCENCGKSIYPIFYRVTVEQIMVDARAANRVLALDKFFGGALGVAEVFAPDDSVTIPFQENSVILCNDCAMVVSLASVLFGKER